MKKKLLVLTALALLTLFACTESKKEEKKEEKSTVAPTKNELQTKIQYLQDSADAAWKYMIEADDQKIALVKRLLDEVSYMKKYDVATHSKLMEKCKALKSKRFDQNTMAVSQNIDNYDKATDSLLVEVKALVLSSPDVENYPLCNELLNDINTLDGSVYSHRVKYDNWIFQYNQTLSEEEENLKKMGEPYASLQKKSVFQLAQ